MPPLSKFAALAALVCVLAACDATLPQMPPLPKWGGGATDEEPVVPIVLFSPNGEPLSGAEFGQPQCDDALERWFGRVDANHDGAIDRQEFLADARVQFGRMDLDHDGFITADELSTFRAAYLPTGRREGRDRRDAPGGATKALPSGVPDPVMSADANLDFKVSLAEFIALAEENFVRLDSDRNGRLGLDEIRKEGCLPGVKHAVNAG